LKANHNTLDDNVTTGVVVSNGSKILI